MSEVRVGALEDIPTASGTLVDVAGTAVAVFRVDEGVYAIADRCSHAEASLSEGEVLDREVECPRHGAIFDIASGAALTLPATKPVATYRAAVRDGEVFVSTNPGEDVQ
ncbi:MAG: non-heme iron oxygenase ferredoxin subunit [Acidimicrobiia bacterium]|nr:MAG: non-heme iron oxygenase ferredoxin subunit [Acidimicrobiia bacterium]